MNFLQLTNKHDHMKKVYYILLLIVLVAHQSCMNSVNDVDFPMTIKKQRVDDVSWEYRKIDRRKRQRVHYI